MKSIKVIYKGYVQLKRKRFWVIRHLILYEDRLVYAENENDIEIRGEYFLADLDISEIHGKESKLIQLMKKKSDEVILLEGGENHKKWFQKLVLTKQKFLQEKGLVPIQQTGNKVIPSNNSPQKSVNSALEEETDHWEKNRVNNNPDFAVKDPSDIRYHYNRGYYIIDRNLVQEGVNNSLIQEGFGVLSLFDTDSKHLIQAFPNFLVYQLGKESPTKQGLTKKLKKGFLFLVDLIFEQFIWKVISLLSMYALFHFQLHIPLYMSFLAFYVLFFNGKFYEILHRVQQNDYDFYLNGYFKSNINEFLKYIKSKADIQSIITFKDKKVFLKLKDNKTKDKYTVVCFLSIFDYDGFTIHTMCRGSKQSYNNPVQFFETASIEIKQMRKDQSSVLYQYYNAHKDTIFDNIHTSSKYYQERKAIQPQQHHQKPTQNLQKKPQQQQQQQIQQESKKLQTENKTVPEVKSTQAEQISNRSEQVIKIAAQIPEQNNEVTLTEQQQGYKNQLKAKSDEMIQLVKLNSDNNWELIDKNKYIQVHRKFNEEKGLVYCRGECIIPVGAKQLEEFLYNVQNQRHYNSYFDFGEELEVITNEMKIIYSITRKIAIVSPRDVVGLQGIIRVGNDTIICCQSIYDKERPPHKKDAVRVDLFIGGFMLQPVSPTETNCIYVVCSDPKGKIPQWVKNMGMKDQAYTPNLLRKYFEKQNGSK